MKHITIIAPDGQTNLGTVACIAGAYEIFTRANEYFKDNGGKETFKIEIAGIKSQTPLAGGLFLVKSQVYISEISKTNLIIIPSLASNFDEDGPGNAGIVKWITSQYKNGAEIATMCSGAFMLASSGLLDGKNCSTHWNYAHKFRALFPKVNLQTDELITDENGIYTNGGAYSFLNLVLYLVEKYYDRQTAIFCSKIFQIEMDRQSQSPFIIFKGQKQHGDEMVREAQAYIESQLTEKISMETLSSKFSIGRRNFDRRFIKATGNTPIEYMQRVKVESAKKSFETTRKSINEVMYEVGYADLKAFREVFRRFTGVSPLAYRSKYNKEALNL
ncbi:GlxA family transcriptional regulator [Mucilaginibacter pocheonensis]|uniref:Transcriptional regulator GlxA family with amidase domain n=1 Tax=Mucilaginibacter pocheonensis TaxID=398050 RepID=A0ABU1TH72_9SPHI|nr:helix-turn-helix domain-containing protein [Mucilaginibacter pocheonensis]MDR6944766.1 transcriptional regulator GlxA family with amidase domain [Mucilaginibacter pocheonensis]